MNTVWHVAFGILIALAILGAVVAYESLSIPEEPKVNLLEYGPEGFCEVDATCGDLVAINCHAEVDGPYYYIDTKTGKKTGECGGLCDNPQGCPTKCPPDEWHACLNESKKLCPNIEKEYYHCVCCCPTDPKVECVYRSKGECMEEVIKDLSERASNPDCSKFGCSQPVLYKYCD